MEKYRNIYVEKQYIYIYIPKSFLFNCLFYNEFMYDCIYLFVLLIYCAGKLTKERKKSQCDAAVREDLIPHYHHNTAKMSLEFIYISNK